MKILGMVLAGGKGTRLDPLTAEHAKPAVNFAAGYRIIDFVLSNLVNSHVSPIFVIGQHKPLSLIEHIRTAWAPWSTGRRREISVVLPGSDGQSRAFGGTADAVYQNRHLIEEPDAIAVFAGDHVYRAAQQDVLGPSPRFSLDNPAWPIRAVVFHTRKPTAAGTSRFLSDSAVHG